MEPSAPSPKNRPRSKVLRLAGVRTLSGLSWLGNATPAAVARFHDEAAALWECAPWEVLSSEEILEVEGLGPETVHLSVRGGEEDEEPGIAVFASREDAGSLKKAEALLLFELPEDAGGDLAEEVRAQGFRLAGPDALPLAAFRGRQGLAGTVELASLERCMAVVRAFVEADLADRESVERAPLVLADRSRVRVTWRELDLLAALGRAPVPPSEAPPDAPEAPPARQPFRAAQRPGRNDPCWCGSGVKYKKCHLDADRDAPAPPEG